MDPDAALQQAAERIRAGEPHEAIGLLLGLIEWLMKLGYRPTQANVDGVRAALDDPASNRLITDLVDTLRLTLSRAESYALTPSSRKLTYADVEAMGWVQRARETIALFERRTV